MSVEGNMSFAFDKFKGAFSVEGKASVDIENKNNLNTENFKFELYSDVGK